MGKEKQSQQDVDFSWNQKEFWDNIFYPEGKPKLYIPPRTWCSVCGKDYELYNNKFTKTCFCDEEACPHCGMRNCRRHI